MIPFIGYLTKPVVLVLVGVVLTGGALAGLYKWSNDRCTATLQEAVNEAETKAAQERRNLTRAFMIERRSYQERINILIGEVDEIIDMPTDECVYPAAVGRLLNNARLDPAAARYPDDPLPGVPTDP